MNQRDSYFGDPIVWTGRPKAITVPPMYRIGAITSGIVALTTTLSAIVVSTALKVAVGSMLIFAAWMAILAVAFWQIPKWWRSELSYTITENNIIIQRKALRRFIDRRAISFARIHWHPSLPGVGDLELVRAVPTGALRRKLTIVLTGIPAPDRVWAFVRGVTPAEAAGNGSRLLSQRLDDGERVLWSAHPSGVLNFMPKGARAAASLGLGLLLIAAAIVSGVRAIHGVKVVLQAGLAPASLSFVALVASVTLSVALLGAVAVTCVYLSVVRPARLDRLTRYLITDRRVLIQRGGEELHLDRERIVDVIDAPGEGGRKDLFLVLDGPSALAFASSGAFGEEPGAGLQPVLRHVDDADAVYRLLRKGSADELPFAA